MKKTPWEIIQEQSEVIENALRTAREAMKEQDKADYMAEARKEDYEEPETI